MPVLEPNEYDISYFDGSKTALKHNAGYSTYERWKRYEGEGSKGEYWLDYATSLFNRHQLAGKKVLELGCAKGFVVEDLRNIGVNAYGLDISSYAIGEATEAIKPYLTVGDARTYLTNYSNREFDAVFSLRFLECIPEANLPGLVTQINRISKFSFHVIDEQPNPDFYTTQPLEWWRDTFSWAKNTWFASNKDRNKILRK